MNNSFDAVAQIYASGEYDAQMLDNLYQIAAINGVVLLPGGKYVQAKCSSYELADLLLPVDLKTWGTVGKAQKAGMDVAPDWFTVNEKGYFSFDQGDLCRAFIKKHSLTRENGSFSMDGATATDDDVKDALRRTLSIVRQDAGSKLYGTFEAIKTLCRDPNEPTSETDIVNRLISRYGLAKAGNRIENRDGQLVKPDAVKRIIAAEIAPYTKTGTARKVEQIFKLLKSFLPGKSADRLNTFSAADLAGAVIPQTPFIVQQILPCGLTAFAAPPKTGKSWLCLALADAIATGSTFWGYPVTAGAVLYLALEDNKARLQSRLRAIGSRMPDNLYMVCRNAMTLDDGLIDQMREWITDHPDTRLIILDTLQRVKGAAAWGQDAYGGDYHKYSPLQEFAVESNIAVLVVHHFRKQGNMPADDVFEMFSGSMALLAASDCAWAISGKRGSEEMNFHLTGRDVTDTEFKITFDKDTSRWKMLGNSEQLMEQRKLDEYNTSPIVKTIRELVKEAGGRWIGSGELLLNEIAKRTETIPAVNTTALAAMIKDMREQLLKQDHITFTHGSGGRKGRDYTFETTQQMKIV